MSGLLKKWDDKRGTIHGNWDEVGQYEKRHWDTRDDAGTIPSSHILYIDGICIKEINAGFMPQNDYGTIGTITLQKHEIIESIEL